VLLRRIAVRSPLFSLVVLLLLLGCVALAASQGPSGSARARNAWLYKAASGKNGWFKKEAGKQWLETVPNGDQHQFEEVARTAQYVEFFDARCGRGSFA
jgi:hypothetical protein